MSEQKLKIAALLGTDLSSRATAVEARNEITHLVSTFQQPIQLDFTDVRTVSHSFADELFAILVAQFGKAWFREWLRLENMSGNIRQTILESISTRIAATPHHP